MLDKSEDKLARAKAQGQAQFDSIKEMVEALREAESLDTTRFQEKLVEEARERIEEDALSVEVRSGWYVPAGDDSGNKPSEYNILLCTGGPACRIIGELDKYCQPSTAVMQVQDWFQPWTDFYPKGEDSEAVLLAYARCFYFGE